ncbi:MAG: ABC transporter substrate-binding protein [Phycisphaeraceae bacterium]|nr:ABC transporter substrate-binding protein [Phycisphaeraceae bacterium]
MMMRGMAMGGVVAAVLLAGCGRSEPGGSNAADATGLHAVKLALNWVPEPEFGGFYAAREIGAYKKHGLSVEILPGGAGAPVVQMIASGQVEFGIVSADEIVIARSKGADVVGLFAVYQTNPQGIMTHPDRGFKSLEDLLTSEGGVTLAMEAGLPYVKYLRKKYGLAKLQVVPYAGGVAAFLNDRNFAQQCFVFSEPLAARRQGVDPQVFLVAESGYNPYTGVMATRGDLLSKSANVARDMVQACREGWIAYLADSNPANTVMGRLNTAMDELTFSDAALEQRPLIVTSEVYGDNIGTMTQARWETLVNQLVELGVIDKPVPAAECFKNF